MTIDQYGLHLTKKEASISVTVLTILSLLIFLTGYFWGKKSAIESFTQKATEDSLNDRADYMLTMQTFAAKNGTSIEELGIENKNQSSSDQVLPDALEEEIDTKTSSSEPVGVPVSSKVSTKANKISKGSQHYALLAGFGKKSLAQQMVDRLQKRNISVRLKTRVSKSASGKSSKTWYQVTTLPYDTVQEVQDVVDRIIRHEKIRNRDIKII